MASFDFSAANGTSLNSLDSNWLGIGGRGNTNWEVQSNAAKETAAVVGNFDDPAGMVYDTADSDVSEITTPDAEAGSYLSPSVRSGSATNEWGYSFTFDFTGGNFTGATLERDKNFVVFQSIAGSISATNVDIRIESTTNGSQIDVEVFLNDTSVGTWTDSSGSRITSLRDGSGFIAYNQGSSDVEIDAWNDGVVGAVPPVLSLPTEADITGTTVTVGCTTDTGPDGTLYWFVGTSATAPAAAALKAGTGAVASGSTATPSIGANTFGVTGLTASTTYYTYFIHEDTEGDSNLLESGSWATIDPSASPAFSVQHFNTDASDGDTVTLSTAVTLANAIILNNNNRYQSGGPAATGNQSNDDISGGLELTGTTTVTVRSPTATNSRFSGSVWEYVGDAAGEHEFSVIDRQAHVLSSATSSTTYTLAGQAANIAEIVPIISGIENDHTSSGAHNATADVSLAVSGSDVEATITRGGSEDTTTVYVQYVRFSGSSWTVHTGSAASGSADTGTITMGSSVADWGDALIWLQHRGDTGNGNQAIADNFPTAIPGSALNEVDYEFDANHDGADGVNRVWVIENSDLAVTRFNNTDNAAGEFTTDITSAGLADVAEAFAIGFAESSGTGTAYGRGWKNFYLNSSTQAGQYVHRSGNNMNNRFQVVDLAGLTYSTGGGSTIEAALTLAAEAGITQSVLATLEAALTQGIEAGITPGSDAVFESAMALAIEQSLGVSGDSILEASLTLPAEAGGAFSAGASLDSALSLAIDAGISQQTVAVIEAVYQDAIDAGLSSAAGAIFECVMVLAAELGFSTQSIAVLEGSVNLATDAGFSPTSGQIIEAALNLAADAGLSHQSDVSIEAAVVLAVDAAQSQQTVATFEADLNLPLDAALVLSAGAEFEAVLTLPVQVTQAATTGAVVEASLVLPVDAAMALAVNAELEASISFDTSLSALSGSDAQLEAALNLLIELAQTQTGATEDAPAIDGALALISELGVSASAIADLQSALALESVIAIQTAAQMLLESTVSLAVAAGVAFQATIGDVVVPISRTFVVQGSGTTYTARGEARTFTVSPQGNFKVN